MSIAATRMYRALSKFLASNMYDILPHLRTCFVLTILGQRHGSSQKALPTSGRTSMAFSQHSMPQPNHSGSNMDEEKSLGKPYVMTVGPVGEDVERHGELS